MTVKLKGVVEPYFEDIAAVGNLDEILKVDSALSSVRTQIEQLQAQLGHVDRVPAIDVVGHQHAR